MADIHGKEISDYIYQNILSKENEGDNFLSQQKVFATKPRGHLRRTVKLDPVVITRFDVIMSFKTIVMNKQFFFIS